MNENLNLVEILKDVPEDTELYCTLTGTVGFAGFSGTCYPISVYSKATGLKIALTAEGTYYPDEDGECILFPSKDQRDWSKFEAPKRTVEKPSKETDLQPDLEGLSDACKGGQESHAWRIPDGYEAKVENGRVIVRPTAFVPRFRIGDWIKGTNGAWQVYNIDSYNNLYFLRNSCGQEEHLVFSYVDKEYRLWDIQDAEPGDVLASGCPVCLVMFRGIEAGKVKFFFHCGMDEDDLYVSEVEDYWGYMYDAHDIFPATKEQCDQLLQKTDKAGYVWDDEKLELRKKMKWEPKPGDVVHYARCYLFPRRFEPAQYVFNEDSRIINGNCFSTEEEAQALCDKLNAAIKAVFDESKKEAEQ